MTDKRTTKTFSVDGTRVLLLPAGPMLVHAIVRERDFTHNRLAGFAHTMEDAHLWAASADLLGVLEEALRYLNANDVGSAVTILHAQGRRAIAKAKP